MFDAPIDTWYVWLGLGAVSIAVAGTVLAFPTTMPPDAGSVADAIDDVASSRHRAVDTVPIDADLVRLGPRRISLENGGERSHARFRFPPIVPVTNGSLRVVLSGSRPSEVFQAPDAFREALTEARDGPVTLRPAPDRLSIRRVSWGDVDATLVG